MAENTSSTRKTIYTSTGYNATSFDHHFSAMNYMWMNEGAAIKFSPIFDEFIGKQPKKGDSAFDYENSEIFAVSPQMAVATLETFELLESNADILSVKVPTGFKDFLKELIIYRPNGIALGKKRHDNYIIKVVNKRKDEESKQYHILQHLTTEITGVDKEVEEYRVETDLKLFKEFLKLVITNAMTLDYHGARRAAADGGGVSSARKSSTRKDIEEDEGIEDDDKPVTKKKKPSKEDINAAFED